MEEFSDQNIVIIGGSYGIGEQVVKQALNAGAKVHSLCRNKPSWMNDFPSLNHQNFDVSKPELFEGRDVNVEIEIHSELTMGMTVVDWWNVTDRQPNVTYNNQINADGFFQLILDRLSLL